MRFARLLGSATTSGHRRGDSCLGRAGDAQWWVTVARIPANVRAGGLNHRARHGHNREGQAVGDAIDRPRAGLSAFGGIGGLRALPGLDVSVSRLGETGRSVRSRPHRAIPIGSDARIEFEIALPLPSFTQDVLLAVWRLGRSSDTRWDRGEERAPGARL